MRTKHMRNTGEARNTDETHAHERFAQVMATPTLPVDGELFKQEIKIKQERLGTIK